MTLIERLNLFRKGLKVERMHTIPHLTPYNNGFHSANAALLALELCRLNNMDSKAIVEYMLLHDVAEGYTGDLPANVKMEHKSLKTALMIVEQNWEERNIPYMPDLSPEEKNLCKVADYCELGMYCIEELELGNKNMLLVLVNVVNYLQAYEDTKGTREFVNYFVARGELSGN